MTIMPTERKERQGPAQAPAKRPSNQGHKFKVGQTLRFMPGILESGARAGDFTVVRLLPAESGENQYRVKSSSDGHERVVREHQLS